MSENEEILQVTSEFRIQFENKPRKW